MAHRVEYRPFAAYLAQLPTTATCADLIASLETYFAADPEMGARLSESVAHLSSDAEWLLGAEKVCEVLRADNPRFVPTLMMEWILEDR